MFAKVRVGVRVGGDARVRVADGALCLLVLFVERGAFVAWRCCDQAAHDELVSDLAAAGDVGGVEHCADARLGKLLSVFSARRRIPPANVSKVMIPLVGVTP